MAINQKWNRDDWGSDVTPLYGQLLHRGLKVLIFSGDTDSVCSTIGTQNWLYDIPDIKVLSHWREWSIDPRESEWQTAGYITKFSGGLTFSTIRNAGHEVPMYRPAEAFHLFSEYLNGSALFASEGLDAIIPWSSETVYGSMASFINITVDLHCKSVKPVKFLDPDFRSSFSFLLRAIRHTLESQGLYPRAVMLQAIAEAPKIQIAVIKSSVKIIATVHAEFNIQYNRLSFAEESLPFPHQESVICPDDVSPVHGAICAARGTEFAPINEKISAKFMKASIGTTDQLLRLAALEVKEKVFAVLLTAEKNGVLMDNIQTAVDDAMLPTADGNSAEIPKDFLIKLEGINIFPGVNDIKVFAGQPAPFEEWDALYKRIPFLDIKTSFPTSEPGVFSNTDNPIFVVTPEVIVVALVTSVITLCAFFVGSVAWNRFFKKSSSRYSKLSSNAAGSYDSEEHGGEVELATSSLRLSY